MKAAFIEETGPPAVIQYGDIPQPRPGPNEVLVRVLAVALNRADLYIRSGYFDAGIPSPYIVGRDVVGVVEATGNQVTAFSQGQRVWSNCMGLYGRQGTFAEYVSVPDDLLFPLPAGVEVEVAAAALHSGLTAVVGLEAKAALRPGETIFINGGSGNVGQAVISLAKKTGARVIATAGSPAKAGDCRALGADAVILYKEVDLAPALRTIAPAGLDVWWEAAPAPDLQVAINTLVKEGRLVIIAGFTSQAAFTLRDFYTRNLTAYGFAVSTLENEVVRNAAPKINAALADGTLRPRIAEILPLSAARLAHQKLEAGPVYGKLVLVPER